MTSRRTDIIVASAALVASSPVAAIAGLLVAATSGRPVIYQAARIGLNGRPFVLYKIRTMESRPGPAVTSATDPRITKVGRILRRWKIDEIPQLVNVIRGEMTLVGPRPEDPRFLSMLEKMCPDVLATVPGLTGVGVLAFPDEQAELRDSDNPEAFYLQRIFPQKCRLESDYLLRRSSLTDFLILLRTFHRVLKR